MKLPVFSVVCAVAATPLFAETAVDHDAHFDTYCLHQAHVADGTVIDIHQKPLTLADFLEWTAISYPTAEKVIVRADRSLQIGSVVYNN